MWINLYDPHSMKASVIVSDFYGFCRTEDRDHEWFLIYINKFFLEPLWMEKKLLLYLTENRCVSSEDESKTLLGSCMECILFISVELLTFTFLFSTFKCLTHRFFVGFFISCGFLSGFILSEEQLKTLHFFSNILCVNICSLFVCFAFYILYHFMCFV